MLPSNKNGVPVPMTALAQEVEEFIRLSEKNYGKHKPSNHIQSQPQNNNLNTEPQCKVQAQTVTLEVQVQRVISILTNATIVQQSLIELLIKKNLIIGPELAALIKQNCALLNKLNDVFGKDDGKGGNGNA